MTDAKGIYWARRSGDYCQPDVCEPPKGQNPNNARHAIWHLSREITMEIYPTDFAWRTGKDDPIEDGRHDRGDCFELTVCAVVQPLSSTSGATGSNQLISNQEGERTEGQIVIHIDSHQQENLDAIAAADDAEVQAYFPNGLRVHGSDMEAPDDSHNHMPLFIWRGRRWKPVSIMEMAEGGDEELHEEGMIYRVVCNLYRDRKHERDAKPNPDKEPLWGPTLARPEVIDDATC